MPAIKNRLRLYLDTNVLLSLLENEEADGVKLGENVAKLLKDAAEGKYQIIASEHTVNELLEMGVPREYVDQVLRPMLLLNGGDLLVTNSDIINVALKTMRVQDIPFMEALHIVFAQRNNALVITRDITFINRARALVGVMTPEEIISF
ncbi:PIN domain-containing protein [Methanocella sp. CWC-04]|uniref:PIN domain-containing protein n=1 Tax=Methanooceanicella nereidis TaxID=2052831 RepID=A0AAP2REJ3_9EURY|nr:PIN domain-containing protein [Methanocella sp. CWC-04]MCD1294722.1 PIN domain-containing protein [Methanocella sp. CWC-04]